MFASLDYGVIRFSICELDDTIDIERVNGWVDHAHRQAYYQVGNELLMSRYQYDEQTEEYDVSSFNRVQLLTTTSALTDGDFIAVFCELEKMSLHTFLREHYDRTMDYNLRMDKVI